MPGKNRLWEIGLDWEHHFRFNNWKFAFENKDFLFIRHNHLYAGQPSNLRLASWHDSEFNQLREEATRSKRALHLAKVFPFPSGQDGFEVYEILPR